MEKNPIELLDELQIKEKLTTVKLPGNWGDELIFRGMEKKLGESEISFQDISEFKGFRKGCKPSSIPSIDERIRAISEKTETFYIHGGGNFNDIYGFSVDWLKTLDKFSDGRIVVGPQSIFFQNKSPESIFENIENEVYFFCRENYSYEKMKDIEEFFQNLNVYKYPDTSFYLRQPDFEGSKDEDYDLISFRKDLESSEPISKTSNALRPIQKDISVKSRDFQEFVEYVASARKIETDRLHIAILGHIFDKKVLLHDNSYYKNRGVYEYCMSKDSKIKFNYLR
jgi:exopolysaccharide biosynthesis predicted pyruvyltransferase EpsI